MKKYLFMIASALLLEACGSNDTEQTEETVAVEQVEESSDSEVMDVTDDPMEAGNKNNDINVIENEWGEHHLIKEWFFSDDTDEEGFNHVDFKGYKVKYSIALVEGDGEEYIGVFAEVDNKTEDELQFNDAFLFVTDTKDQTELEHGIRKNKPNTKEKFYNYAELEYGTPSELTVEILPPFKDGESELIDIGEPIELEFSIE